MPKSGKTKSGQTSHQNASKMPLMTIPTLFITSEDDAIQDSQNGLGTSSQLRHFKADEDATSIALLLDSGNVTPIVEESSIPLTLGNLLSSGSGKLQVSDSSLMEEITISSADDDKEASVTFIPHGADKNNLPNYSFIQWNWTVIRTLVFVVLLAVILGCFGTSVALITQIPNNCDPETEWWQGKIFYEIFPASFFDSDNDGIGDLQGLNLKLDYLKNDLNVDVIRLNSIFEVKYYPEHYLDIINATNVDPRLGDTKHFRNLVHNIENRNLSLIIDLPVDHLPGIGDSQINKESTDTISSIIIFWLHHGVHGFYLKGLGKFDQQQDLWKSVALWKTIIDGFSSTRKKRRILMTSSEFLSSYGKNHPEYSSKMHDQFELVDHYIDMTQIGDLENQMKNGLVWDNDVGKSWIIWNVGNIDKPRLANLSHGQGCNSNFGSLMLLFTLPGSVSVFYGDEIGLNNVQSTEGDNIAKNLQNLPIMQWNESPNVGFTSASSLPWLPVTTPIHSSYCIHTSVMKFGHLTNMRNMAVPLRVNVISKYKDDIIESRIHNYIYRLFYNDTALIERYYPRRHRYLLINNISQKNVTHDLSSQYFGGQTLLSSTGKKEGYVKLKGLGLQPGESLLLLLDK